jgi:cellulose synthase/poly-beta-1,6-N-acetylglucosamine synthase-like glycosyltransferase
MVSIIIAARNEEKYIQSKIENLTKLDYPKEKLEIIVVSDGSTDNTNDILNKFATDGTVATDPAVHLKNIELAESGGKPNALNLGVSEARGEFILFTDVRQHLEPDALKELVANFKDPKVGCASGELIFYEDTHTSIKSEMLLYWNFEKRVREMESLIHSVPGATGAIYAIRRSLFQKIPAETLLDDVYIPMSVVLQGHRAIFDRRALAYDTISEDFSQEKKRKVRTLLGNYQLLSLNSHLLSPLSNPIFFRYLSHKIFRLFVPFFFFILVISSYMAHGILYKVIFLMCMIILILPIIDKLFTLTPIIKRLAVLSWTFIFLNYFAILALIFYIKPGKKEIW